MPTTVATLIQQTWNKLYTSHRRTIAVLAGSLDASTTSVTVDDASQIASGHEVEVDDEMMRVRSVSDNTLTVIRGWAGTTAATHADGSIVDLNPKFPRHQVRQALGEELRSWPADVYRVDEVDLDTASGTSGYDLTGVTSLLEVLDVQLGPRSLVNDVAVVRPTFDVVRNADVSIYPSGTGIVLLGLVPSEARDLRVIYSAPFDTSSLADPVDAEATIGLASSMLDIPVLGAASRMMVGREVKRSFGEGQGEPRRAEEIPPGMSSGTATFLRREVQRRLGEEAMRLRAVYGLRRT